MQIKSLRTKSAEVLAMQFDGGKTTIREVINLILDNGGVASLECASAPCTGIDDPHYLTIHTPTGIEQVHPTDWIFMDADKKFFRVTDVDREAQYEDND